MVRPLEVLLGAGAAVVVEGVAEAAVVTDATVMAIFGLAFVFVLLLLSVAAAVGAAAAAVAAGVVVAAVVVVVVVVVVVGAGMRNGWMDGGVDEGWMSVLWKTRKITTQTLKATLNKHNTHHHAWYGTASHGMGWHGAYTHHHA